MSNEVYGFIEGSEVTEWEKCFSTIQEKTGIGIKLIPESELYNFPMNVLPSEAIQSVAFIIGDKPEKTNTTYLTDYQDYAPEADIGFPVRGKERLTLLLDMFMTTITCTCATRFVVAITDSSQIDEVKKVDVDEFAFVISRDFKEFSPPDCIYDICVN